MVCIGLLKIIDAPQLHPGSETEQLTLVAPELAKVIGLVEVVIGVGLITTWWRTCAWCSLFVLLAFNGYLIFVVVNGEDFVDCGCFGRLPAPIGAHASVLMGMTLLSGSCALARQ